MIICKGPLVVARRHSHESSRCEHINILKIHLLYSIMKRDTVHWIPKFKFIQLEYPGRSLLETYFECTLLSTTAHHSQMSLSFQAVMGKTPPNWLNHRSPWIFLSLEMKPPLRQGNVATVSCDEKCWATRCAQNKEHMQLGQGYV